MSLLFLNTKDGNVETRTTVVSEHASQIIKDGNKNKAINLNYFELLELMRDELVTVMRNMQYYPYPTKPSRSCSYCPYTLICDDSAV
jgi:CRISPR/Cas system-associated exonuclease Cas4 (RecB family)